MYRRVGKVLIVLGVLLWIIPFSSLGAQGGMGMRMNVSNPPTITNQDKTGLIHMIEEEKLAHDVYQYLYNKWDMPIFRMIIRSESNHMRTIARLLSLYSINNPVAGRSMGTFTIPEMTKLYKKLISKGSKSKIDALKIGATIEDLDIYDLEKYINNTKNTLIKKVYSNLMRGSRNHMRLFIRNLKNLGGSYTPQFISKSLFKQIISTPLERGGMGRSRQF